MCVPLRLFGSQGGSGCVRSVSGVGGPVPRRLFGCCLCVRGVRLLSVCVPGLWGVFGCCLCLCLCVSVFVCVFVCVGCCRGCGGCGVCGGVAWVVSGLVVWQWLSCVWGLWVGVWRLLAGCS